MDEFESGERLLKDSFMLIMASMEWDTLSVSLGSPLLAAAHNLDLVLHRGEYKQEPFCTAVLGSNNKH